MVFNNTLKLLLEKRNLKQAELCRMTGIQTSLMSDYLGGKKSPTIGNAILIADALNISLDTLVGKDTSSNPVIKQESKLLSKLCEEAKTLSEDEQLYLLDTIKALKEHLRKQRK